MFKKLLVIATLAAGLISTQASAAFVATDWKSIGDGLATLDTQTGLEWLDLTQTFNLTYSQVNERLMSDLLGWRYATYSEVIQLMSRFFDSDPFTWTSQFMPSSDDSPEELEYWRSLFGVNSAAGQGISMGIVRFNEADTTQWNLFGPYHYGQNRAYVAPTTGGYAYPGPSGFAGYFIVSDGGTTLSSINDPSININNPNAPINMADVSAPAGLAAAGVLMLMMGARRKVA